MISFRNISTKVQIFLQNKNYRRQPHIYVGAAISIILVYELLQSDAIRNNLVISGVKSPYTNTGDECFNVVKNGDFSDGTTDWNFIGQNTGLLLISSDTIPQAKNSDGKDEINQRSALSTMQRNQWYDGMSQTLKMSCLKENEYYEISLNAVIRDYDGKLITCDPFQYHFDPNSKNTCPTIALKLESKDKEMKTIPIGKSIGPWISDKWNQMYGIFRATPELFQQKRVEIFVGYVHTNFNVVIDNVVIKPVSTSTIGLRTCSIDLIMNGDAELKDARFWYLKGGGRAGPYGELDIISTTIPYSERRAKSNHAFYHHGNRKQWWNGMWQKLDQNCMGVGSQWKISFDIKILNKDGDEIGCNVKKTRSCPEITIESITIGGDVHTTNRGNLAESFSKEWRQGEWNRFETLFTMTEEHKSLDETWFYINMIEPRNGYIVDNISMKPLSF